LGPRSGPPRMCEMGMEHVSAVPRVSVAMAVYNGERYLRQAVDSVLAQTFCDFEFLIVDDGSTDSTPEILAGYGDRRVVVISNSQNVGLTRSLNRCLERARGEYVARMDADDVSMPTRLEKQAAYLDRHPAVGLRPPRRMRLAVQLLPGGCVAAHGCGRHRHGAVPVRGGGAGLARPPGGQ